MKIPKRNNKKKRRKTTKLFSLCCVLCIVLAPYICSSSITIWLCNQRNGYDTRIDIHTFEWQVQRTSCIMNGVENEFDFFFCFFNFSRFTPNMDLVVYQTLAGNSDRRQTPSTYEKWDMLQSHPFYICPQMNIYIWNEKKWKRKRTHTDIDTFHLWIDVCSLAVLMFILRICEKAIIIICLESDFGRLCLTETYPFTTQKFSRIEPKRRLNILNIYQRDNSVLFKATGY